MMVVWFLMGVVCGVALCLWWRRGKAPDTAHTTEGTSQPPTKAWGETRNFLYYDGTVMPEIKEDLHEQ